MKATVEIHFDSQSTVNKKKIKKNYCNAYF